MAKLTRFTQLIFGSAATVNQIAEFGSLAAGSPQTYAGNTITPSIVQTLSNYLTGWFGAVIGANSPAIEDMNAICWLYAYQLAYLMQEGVAEWDSATTYFKGSIVNSSGVLYVSLIDNNLNNAVTVAADWSPFTAVSNIVTINPSTQSPYTLTSADVGKTFLVQSNNAAMQFNLPTPIANFPFTVVDRDGNFATNNCTIHRHAAENFENLAADFVMAANAGTWAINGDGTNWFITG